MSRNPNGLVRIVRIPEGKEPEEIRKRWHGLILWYTGMECSEERAEKQHSVMVPQEGAIKILERIAPDTAKWWKENGYPKKGGCFRFGADGVRIIKEAEN